MIAIMSAPRHWERLEGHYVSSAASYMPEFFERLNQVTRNDPFWAPPG